MAKTYNAIGWFEIPVFDMERAIKFYQSVFGVELTLTKMGPLDIAFFPHTEGSIGCSGSLVFNKEYYKPSSEGVIIYFNSQTGDLNDELDLIEKAGGTVLQPKTLIAEEIGHMAIFLDSEGNRIAIHSSR